MNNNLQQIFRQTTGCTFDIEQILAYAQTEEKRKELLKWLAWMIPDGVGPDNTKEIVQRNVEFINNIADELNVELKDVFTDTDGDGDVDAYDVISAPEEKQQWPKNNEIWYTTTDGEIYDLKRIIEMFPSVGTTYTGPAVVSNEYDEEKQMWCMTFDDDVTVLGDFNTGTMTIYGPFFGSNSDYELVCNVETIILPKTTIRIGKYAFQDCTGLTSIKIPDSVTSIGHSAFYGCYGLTSVNIPNSITSIEWEAFDSCYGLTSVTISNSVTSIEEYTFQGCSSLTSITIPNSVTSIGGAAFQGCTALTSITIGSGVTSISENAFYVGDEDFGDTSYPGSLQTITVVGGQAYNYAQDEHPESYTIRLANNTEVTLEMWWYKEEEEYTVYDEGYDVGYSDYQNSGTTTNPYEYETDDYNEWERGYSDGWDTAESEGDVPETFNFYVEDENGSTKTCTCDEGMSWSEWFGTPEYNSEAYNTLYTKNTYDSSIEDVPEVNGSPTAEETYYDYCEDTYEEEEGPSQEEIDAAYDEGYDAGHSDYPNSGTTTNPYGPEQNDLYQAWESGYSEGWNDAESEGDVDDLPRMMYYCFDAKSSGFSYDPMENLLKIGISDAHTTSSLDDINKSGDGIIQFTLDHGKLCLSHTEDGWSYLMKDSKGNDIELVNLVITLTDFLSDYYNDEIGTEHQYEMYLIDNSEE